MSVDVKTDDRFEAGAPKPLFEIIPSFGLFYPQVYSVTPDGQRFLVKSPLGQENSPAITVVVNWAAGLKR